MMFISFDLGAAAVAKASTASTASPQTAPAGFSRLEFVVIAASQGDDLRSVDTPGWLVRQLHLVFGVRRDTRLADPRLETLRSVCVRLRHGGVLPEPLIEEFFAAGFTAVQLGSLPVLLGVKQPCAWPL
jgi:hypothetical protein